MEILKESDNLMSSDREICQNVRFIHRQREIMICIQNIFKILDLSTKMI